MRTIRIKGAITSNTGVTLYLENATELNLLTTDWKTKAIMDQITPVLARKKIAEIDLDRYSAHAAVETKTGGFIRFFKDKVSALASLFKSEERVEIGDVPPSLETIIERGQAKAAKPAVDPAPIFGSDENTVAVVNNKVIPNVDGLQRHIEHAAETGNTVGLERFMDRISKVIDTRSHSIEELMNFMRRGDLPIADDGTIVAYKVLKTITRDEQKVIVDCHSGSVTQRVGSRVVMDEKLVDHNRRNECSTGLHIARRGYLRHFYGDVIMLVKVAPEDVIAVPPGEPDKMRAAAYQVVARLPDNIHQILRDNQPMTSNETAAKILADVIAGRHTPVIEEVRIGAAMGGNVTVTAVGENQSVLEPKFEVKTTELARALDDKPEQSEVLVTPQDINKIVAEVVAEQESAKERRNRVKREKRAANKLKADKIVADKVTAPPTDKLKMAAMTGNFGAALSAAATAPDPEPVKAEEPKSTLPEKHQQALKLRAEGKSNRQIEAELHICRKTLKKLFDKHPA